MDTMPDLTPESVTAENAAEIAVRMARTLGGGWHPEDDLHEYVWIESGEPVLSPEDADRLNRVVDAVYAYVDACAAILDAETPDWRDKYDEPDIDVSADVLRHTPPYLF